MQIANPIYDVVFKYLLEDNDIARLLVATILGREVAEISPLPQEKTIPMEQRRFTVYRLDYSARIRNPDGGYEQVIIEIQKAKFPADIMRFRRYPGNQYHRKNICISLPSISWGTRWIDCVLRSSRWSGNAMTSPPASGSPATRNSSKA